MAIYNIFESKQTAPAAQQPDLFEQAGAEFSAGAALSSEEGEKGQIFSAIAARFFFLLLLAADVVWSLYSLTSTSVKFVLAALSAFQLPPLNRSLHRSWLGFKRSLVCGIALFVAIFAPALGIMFSCMYFLMYDKSGVEEVVPSSLRDQFKDFLPSEWF